ELIPVTPGLSGWAAWSPAQAESARRQYEARNQRRARAERENAARLEAKAEHKLAHLEELTKVDSPTELDRKRTVIEAALARARARRSTQD
ncbi:MAG: hypothetical protein RJA44_2039, partial [Pseudomonadota bacterium]